MQALAQWRHPVASSEDREVLQWAMRPTSYHHIRVVNEITSNLPALLCHHQLCCCPQTYIKVALYAIWTNDFNTILYDTGAHRWQQILFWSPFLTVGEQLVKNASHENKGCCERPLFEQRRKKEPEQLPRALSSISLLVELCDHEYSYLFVPDALITHFVFLPGLERHLSYCGFGRFF